MRTLLTSAGVACATFLALCFAAISASHWIIDLQGQHLAAISIVVVASVCVSLMTPVCAYLSRSYGYLLIVPALVFLAMDTYQNAEGFQTLSGLKSATEITAQESRIQTAQTQLDGLMSTTFESVCIGHGPLNCAARQDGLKADRSAASTALDTLKAELETLSAPDTDLKTVMMAMLMIQIALSLVFACLGKQPETEPVPEQSAAVEPDLKAEEPEEKPTQHLQAEHSAEILLLMDKIGEKVATV